jgi:hypothetical protein
VLNPGRELARENLKRDVLRRRGASGGGERAPRSGLRRARDLHGLGEIEISGDVFVPGQLLVFRPGDRITIRARSNARFMMLGGEPMDGPRIIWWNFVSSRMDRIEQAKADWKAARFDTVPGDSEFIPLPEPEPRPVRYP